MAEFAHAATARAAAHPAAHRRRGRRAGRRRRARRAVSTRRLAAALGVRGPSLYNHFATKDEILDAVADAVTARVDTSFFATHDWRDALRLWGRSYREALAAHPNIVPYLAQGPGRRPAALAMADAVYGGLVAAGWPPARATHIGALMRYLVAGSALGSFARGFVDDPDLYAGDYPHLDQAHRLADHQQERRRGRVHPRPGGTGRRPRAGSTGTRAMVL